MHYTFSINSGLAQGDTPTIAALRHADDGSVQVVKIGEAPGRNFDDEIMTHISEMAAKIAQIEKRSQIDAHLIFSGRAFTAGDYHELLAELWPHDAYSLVTITNGGQHGHLEGSGGDPALGYPINHFTVPRLSIIASLNFAQARKGRLVLSLPHDELKKLQEQMGEFTERSNKLPANDPDAMLEYQGEGQVLSMGIGVWHAFRSASIIQQWSSDHLLTAAH